MLSKFAFNLALKFHPISFNSTSKIYTPCDESKKIQKRDWRLEVASVCDSNEILCFVEDVFLKEEPLVRSLIPRQKPKILQNIFRKMLEQELTIVARQCCDKKTIVGVSINHLSNKMNAFNLCKMISTVEDCNLQKLLEVWTIINYEPKLYEKLCCDEIFNAAFLSVAETHYGQGMGLEMVKTSFELAREKNFKYAMINCTSDNTRKIADELKMKKAWSAPYKEIMNRGSFTPSSLPDPPHCNAVVYYIDLKKDCE